MTPGQIILPPFWLHAWECVLKSGSIPRISPPVTGTGDLGDDDFLYIRSDDPGSWRPPMNLGSCQPSNCRPPGSPSRCPKRKPTYDPWKPQTFELNQATGQLCRRHEGRTGPVEPTTLVKVEAPLEEGCCGWVGPRFEIDTPRVIS